MCIYGLKFVLDDKPAIIREALAQQDNHDMQRKYLAQIISVLKDVISIDGDISKTTIISPVVESNNDIEQGGVFVARSGHNVDGHDFIKQAIERGAAAIVGERDIRGLRVPYIRVSDAAAAIGPLSAAYYDFPSRSMCIVGVTGTDGKTTTSHLIHSILRESTGGRAGFISTIAADLGDTQVETGLHVTTPGAPQIQKYLSQMLWRGMTHCVLEMTSHGLAQGRLNGVELDVAVLTNVTHEHLDYHGSWEAYRDAKASMFQMLSRTKRKPGQRKLSVINGDDPSAAFFQRIPANRVIRYGLRNQAHYQAKNPYYLPTGTQFEVDGDLYISELVGEFNLMNMLAAVATTREMGCDVSAVRRGLEQVKAISGRMERINEGQDFTAIVDFAHTPNALRKALEAARVMLQQGGRNESEHGRLIAVFGSAGLRDREKRRLMAQTAMELADFTILTAEDPRTESLDDILAEMAQGATDAGGIELETFIRVPDRGLALYEACQRARRGDIVIACGKGHEQSMCFGTVEYPWDDREAMRAALRGEPLRTLPTAQV